MSVHRVKWGAEIEGYINVEADSEEDAVANARALVGSGVSVAANLHAPPGVSIKSVAQIDTKSKPEYNGPQLVLPEGKLKV
jgi:hypothetical protein